MKLKLALGTAGLVTLAAAAFAWGGGARVTKVNGTAWRDSLADAQAESRRTGKPILLLSMFGRIDEDLPCMNARTLRATLFKDPEFRTFVENEAIPAWEMVRPVPRVTIDFGNGKQLVRTVRGNAVMYLVNADGRVFDAFPGVYTKDDFLPAVRESIAKLAHADAATVKTFHANRAQMIPSTEITRGKTFGEGPTLRLIGARTIPGAFVRPVAQAYDSAKADFLLAASRLMDLSLTPMSSEEALARVTGRPVGQSDPKVEAKAVMARDSKLNMERTRSVVHYFFAAEKGLPTPLEARDAVLGTILKIPYKDPTMGLSDILVPGTPE